MVFVTLIAGLAASARGADTEMLAYYSPKAGSARVLAHEIDSAQHSILIQAYPFVSRPVADALLRARKRGVKIDAILDQSQRTTRHRQADFLSLASIRIVGNTPLPVVLDKVIVIDDKTLITGSFEFSRTAQLLDRDNLVVVRDAILADEYTKLWQEHVGHTEAYSGR